ncbi:MAG: hypothetical protein DWH86_00165 [Planctomycetota bacterium]|nr:MAG: hypothetical protein DWH86_00165 [Planctomycetota bacterium]
MNSTDATGTLWESHSLCAIAERPHARVIDESVAAGIRSAYFAESGELAVRYGISVADVIEHLETAGLGRMPRPERAIENIKCAVHAAALTRGVAQSWADLQTVLAPGFDRACAARLDAMRGIAFARRFWIDLRMSTLHHEDRLAAERRDAARRGAAGILDADTPGSRSRTPLRRPRGVRAPDLRTFAATRPLRYWLAERLLGSLEVELGRAASASERLDTVEEVRTLRIPAQMAAGAETRPG